MKATILYPTMEEDAREARVTINDPMYGTGRAHIILRPVNLLQLDQFITEERNVGAGLVPALSTVLPPPGPLPGGWLLETIELERSHSNTGDHKGFCWRMTLLVAWRVACAFFLLNVDGILPTQLASQLLSCIVGAYPCGRPRGGREGDGPRMCSISRIRQQSLRPTSPLLTALAPTELDWCSGGLY
jgi:hypothetical protein